MTVVAKKEKQRTSLEKDAEKDVIAQCLFIHRAIGARHLISSPLILHIAYKENSTWRIGFLLKITMAFLCVSLF